MDDKIGVAWEFNPNHQSQIIKIGRYVRDEHLAGRKTDSLANLVRRYTASGCKTFEEFKARFLKEG